MSIKARALITAKEAFSALKQSSSSVKIINASWYMPNSGVDALKNHQDSHIPDSQFFNIDQIADTTVNLPHMLPSPEVFHQAVGELGIDKSSQVICYDDNNFFASARAWWMFRYFGHDDVYVLNGGLKAWQKEQLPISSEITQIDPTTYANEVNKPYNNIQYIYIPIHLILTHLILYDILYQHYQYIKYIYISFSLSLFLSECDVDTSSRRIISYSIWNP